MPARKAGEPSHLKHVIFILTDLPRNHGGSTLQLLSEPANRIGSNLTEVRVTSGQQIRTRFASEILQALCGRKREDQGNGQAHPPDIPFPEFAAQGLRFRRSGPADSCRTRHEYQSDDENDGRWCYQRRQNQGAN